MHSFSAPSRPRSGMTTGWRALPAVMWCGAHTSCDVLVKIKPPLVHTLLQEGTKHYLIHEETSLHACVHTYRGTWGHTPSCTSPRRSMAFRRDCTSDALLALKRNLSTNACMCFFLASNDSACLAKFVIFCTLTQRSSVSYGSQECQLQSCQHPLCAWLLGQAVLHKQQYNMRSMVLAAHIYWQHLSLNGRRTAQSSSV